MSKIYNFPTLEDRNLIIEAARLCARNIDKRNEVNKLIASIIRKYGITQMHVGNLLITDYGNFISPLNGLPFDAITMEATVKADGATCPNCGAFCWHYLSGEGFATFECGKCGEFYLVDMVKLDIALNKDAEVEV
jgi:ribosomal protein S27AE